MREAKKSIDEEAKKAVANGAIDSRNELNQHVTTLVNKFIRVK